MADHKPNVFLIGVQKAATTSLYDWIAQHPEVCGPFSMKDTPFFIDDSLYDKGQEFLNRVYSQEYDGQRIIINGSANIIYFEKALERIALMNSEAKILLVLRDPAERAISAYKFARKRNMENRKLEEAIDQEEEGIKTGDLRYLANNTYVDHGRYYKQIKTLFKYFSKEQVLILFYTDIKNDPKQTISRTYKFLGIEPRFSPELKTLNPTGEVRYRWIRNLLYSESKVKKFLVRYIVDPLIPYDFKYRAKIYFLNLITGTRKSENREPPENLQACKSRITKILIEDIEQLETLLNKDLSGWKAAYD